MDYKNQQVAVLTARAIALSNAHTAVLQLPWMHDAG